MFLTDNRYFILASAQLFPLTTVKPVTMKVVDAAFVAAEQAYTSFKDGELSDARELYTAAIQRFPDQPFFYACRSILNNLLGDDEGAFYDYQVAKSLDFNYQAFLEWTENSPEAATFPGEVTELKPLLAAALEATQQFDYEQALKLYAQAREAYPAETDVLVYQAALHMRLLRYDCAGDALDQAIAMDPNHFQAYLFRAKLFKAVREYDRAKADFDKAVSLQPASSMLYEERGGFLMDIKRYEEALMDFDELVKLLPEDFYVYALRADLFEKIENWEKAIEDYSTAISLNPYYSDLYAYRAEMKDRVGDTTGAAEDRRMFAELEKED